METTRILVFAAATCGGAPADEVDSPILPGWGKYFWNKRSAWHLYPPAFEYATVPKAAS